MIVAEATPLQAGVAELFEERASWTSAELSEKLGVDEVQIRSAVAFWAGFGVVKDDRTTGQWRLLEFAEEVGTAPSQLNFRIGYKLIMIAANVSGNALSERVDGSKGEAFQIYCAGMFSRYLA